MSGFDFQFRLLACVLELLWTNLTILYYVQFRCLYIYSAANPNRSDDKVQNVLLTRYLDCTTVIYMYKLLGQCTTANVRLGSCIAIDA